MRKVKEKNILKRSEAETNNYLRRISNKNPRMIHIRVNIAKNCYTYYVVNIQFLSILYQPILYQKISEYKCVFFQPFLSLIFLLNSKKNSSFLPNFQISFVGALKCVLIYLFQSYLL